MKFWLVLLTCCFYSFDLYANSKVCEALAGGIEVSFPQGLPESVQADSSISFPIKINVKDQSLLEPFRTIPVTIIVSNGQIGAKKYFDFLFLKDTTSSTPRFNEDFQINIHFAANTFGLYKAFGELAFYDERWGSCSAVIKNIPHNLITVLNDPAKADTYAPILTSVKTDRIEYNLNDTLNVDFTAVDKSPICTKEQNEQSPCETVGHVAAIEISTGREVDAYPKYISQIGDSYRVSFEMNVAAGFTAGKYKIVGINVYDIWGNTNHQISGHLQPVFSVN